MSKFKVQRAPNNYRIQYFDPKTKKMYTEWAPSRYLAIRAAELMAKKLGLEGEPEIEYGPWSATETPLGISTPRLD